MSIDQVRTDGCRMHRAVASTELCKLYFGSEAHARSQFNIHVNTDVASPREPSMELQNKICKHKLSNLLRCRQIGL